jgi:hypothetical protein
LTKRPFRIIGVKSNILIPGIIEAWIDQVMPISTLDQMQEVEIGYNFINAMVEKG